MRLERYSNRALLGQIKAQKRKLKSADGERAEEIQRYIARLKEEKERRKI